MKQAYRRKERSARGLLLILADFCASLRAAPAAQIVLYEQVLSEQPQMDADEDIKDNHELTRIELRIQL
jgi:hypothetical protein